MPRPFVTTFALEINFSEINRGSADLIVQIKKGISKWIYKN